MEAVAKYMIYIGILLVITGVFMYLFNNQLGWLGKTPLDFSYKSENIRIYFPIGTMLIISIVLTLILNFFK